MLTLCLLSIASAWAHQEGTPWNGDPIRYEEPSTDDPVARLGARLEAGAVEPYWDPARGWLPWLLEALAVPAESQTLVFSKTSFQNARISPQNPRAIYFADDVYVGYVPDGSIMEVSAADPEKGMLFYSLRQREGEPPRFDRQDAECLQCHATGRTRGWPGNLIRSVHPDPTGFPILRSGTFQTTHASPLRDRWGGWYVTGTSGGQPHMGNVWVAADDADEMVDRGAGSNLTELDGRFDGARYLSAHSDIVALMVLEHQAEMHNRLARAGYEARLALHQQAGMNQALGDAPGTLSESTRRRLERAAQQVVEHLLFADEVRLTDSIVGTSGFAASFSARGPHDSRGRSLFELDLERWLFRYPCSFLVYSPAFDGLPEPVLASVWRRLDAALSETAGEEGRLSTADRLAVRQILAETKPGAAAAWR